VFVAATAAHAWKARQALARTGSNILLVYIISSFFSLSSPHQQQTLLLLSAHYFVAAFSFSSSSSSQSAAAAAESLKEKLKESVFMQPQACSKPRVLPINHFHQHEAAAAPSSGSASRSSLCTSAFSAVVAIAPVWKGCSSSEMQMKHAKCSNFSSSLNSNHHLSPKTTCIQHEAAAAAALLFRF